MARHHDRHMRTLLLGEAVVDLVCDRRGDADAFVPHVGGGAATIAATAAAAGADVALAGTVGDDAWGQWLRERLGSGGVDTALLGADGERPTPLTFTIDGRARLHGAVIAQAPAGLDDAVDAAAALVVTADTLAGEEERAATLAARDRAAGAGKPVVADLTFGAHRWETPAFAASAARELVKDTFLAGAGAEEARLLTGEDEPAAAADGLVAMGARHAVVVGPAGAVLRGQGLRLHTEGSTPAPGVVLGTVLADLAGTDFYPAAIAAALPRVAGRR
jgi:sugar/nucleoside kinase (ribokinase family)